MILEEPCMHGIIDENTGKLVDYAEHLFISDEFVDEVKTLNRPTRNKQSVCFRTREQIQTKKITIK